MIDLWKYQEAKKIKVIDIDGVEHIGNVVDVTDSEEFLDEDISEDAITIEVGKKHIEFLQSEIKGIERID